MNAEPDNSIDRGCPSTVNDCCQVDANLTPKTASMIARRARRWRTNTAAKSPLLAGLVFFLAATSGLAQVRTRTVSLDDLNGLKARNVKVEKVTYKGRRALRITDEAPDADNAERLVILNGTEFRDGVIEIDLTGEPGPGAREGARGFVGVAFRVASDAKQYECFYLRPTNGRAEDQVRRNHSLQYISFPDFPWPRLRKEFPEKYESYTDLVPGEWTKVRIEVQGDKARLFVHDARQPSLLVNDLKHGQSQGGIALWIGPGTVAHFSNLRVSK